MVKLFFLKLIGDLRFEYEYKIEYRYDFLSFVQVLDLLLYYIFNLLYELFFFFEINMKIEGFGYVIGLECEKIMCFILYLQINLKVFNVFVFK